jgi:hypothetical protein
MTTDEGIIGDITWPPGSFFIFLHSGDVNTLDFCVSLGVTSTAFGFIGGYTYAIYTVRLAQHPSIVAKLCMRCDVRALGNMCYTWSRCIFILVSRDSLPNTQALTRASPLSYFSLCLSLPSHQVRRGRVHKCTYVCVLSVSG